MKLANAGPFSAANGLIVHERDRFAIERRFLVALTLLAAIAATALIPGAANVRRSLDRVATGEVAAGEVARGEVAKRGLASLPLAAQGPIAAALGHADAAYLVRRLAMDNPAQRLHAHFSASGVSMASGTGRLGLSLVAYGRAGAVVPVAPVDPRVSANRVTYARGALSEWYANGPLGLEQGFDLARRAGGGSGPLAFAVGLSGNLAPRLVGRAIAFSSRGVSLRYAGLVATDARGRVLRSWLELSGGRLLIKVADRGARYPLHVDPIVQQAQLTASGAAANDIVGWSVAVSGNTAVVGAPQHAVNSNAGQGIAYVFVEPAAGWATTSSPFKLTASDGAVNDEFGYSVAIDGTTVVVGAPFHAVNGTADQGAAYVFTMPSGGWVSTSSPTAELTAGDGATNDGLGWSVAVSGSTIVAGAPSHAVGPNTAQGAAYVFTMPSGGWVNGNDTAELTATDGAAGDSLGEAVAVSSDTVVAGAPTHAVGGNAGQGAVYAFTMPPGGWANGNETAEMTASDGAAGDGLGRSVAIDADTVVAGAPMHAVGSAAAEGAAYVFAMPSGGWVSGNETAELTASDSGPIAGLGRSVSISGNEIVAGAHFRTIGCNTDTGAVYGYAMPPGGWATTSSPNGEFAAANGSYDDLMGDSVANSGNTIVGGAPFHTVGKSTRQGAADVFQFQTAPVSDLKPPAVSGSLHWGQTLSVNPGTWSSPDSVTYGYQWQRCVNNAPVNIAGATLSSYTLTKADVGYGVTVAVTATDVEGQSALAIAHPTGLVGSPLPPSSTGAPVISGSPQDGQTLNATTGSWYSPLALTYTYQWLVCDSHGANCNWGPATTTPSHTLDSTTVGSMMSVVVTAKDTQSQKAEARAVDVGPVAPPAPPSSTSPPVISGTPKSGALLTASPGSWSSPDKLRYAFQWQLCASDGTGCANITGAGKNSYRLISADVGREVTVVVTASDKENQTGQATPTPVGPVTS